MNRIKVCIIGNSVALRVRPPRNRPENLNYSQLLDNSIILNNNQLLVNNLGIGAFTIKNMVTNIDHYINEFPNYYIVNTGVVDASTRNIPLWFYRITQKKVRNPIVYLSNAIQRVILSPYRPFLVKLRGKRTWVSRKKFKQYFSDLISTLKKETNAKIIVLSINHANERVEKTLPGSLKNHKLYSEIMQNITEQNNQYFIDTNSIINQDDYPDGVHFSTSGHEKIAMAIKQVIEKDLELNPIL